MKKLPLIVVVFLIVIGCSTRMDKESAATVSTGSATEASAGERFNDRPAPPRPAPIDLSLLNGNYDEIFNDSNYLQYMSAERLGIDPLEDLHDAYNTRRPLVKIESGKNYILADLTHSMPYLVPEAAQLLDEIGEEFARLIKEDGGSEGNKFVVTSVLRSPYSVKKLRRVNSNAVDSSTHMFATTFDIGYNNFYCADSTAAMPAGRLKALLGKALLQKRNEGKCFVKHEKKSPCFHITVNKD